MRAFFKAVPQQLYWLIAGFVVLCLFYMWATPLFEASDEVWHFGLVDHISRTGQLPVQKPHVETAWEQEGSQPPLYYLISALLVGGIDRSDFDLLRQANPHVKAGIPGASDNKNLVMHDVLPHPLQKTALAVYGLRLFGIGLGVMTVCGVYASGRLLGGEKVALAAAGLTAFNPMFLFITSSVNNDNLVTALNSIVIWQMLTMLRTGFSARRSVVLALIIALASLSKLSGLVVVPAVALAALWVGWQRRDWRGVFILGLLMAAVWLVVASWWYIRNLTLYDELFGTRMMAAVAGTRDTPFTLQTLFDEFEGFRIAYWGLFGAVNIQTFSWFYLVMDLITAAGVVGLGWHVWRRRADRAYLMRIFLLAGIIFCAAVSLIFWTAQTYASQGRLLFPVGAATSTLLALGLWQIFKRYAIKGVVGLGMFALYVPFGVIAPIYSPPTPIDHVPTDAQQVYARFSDTALIGYATVDRRYQPGDVVPVTVYWQVLAQADRDYSLFLTFLDDQGKSIGKIDTYPAGGRLRTTTWQPSAIYADSYLVPLSVEAEGRYALRMQVGWWDFQTKTYIQAVDEAGMPLESVILNIGAFAHPDAKILAGDLVEIEPVSFGEAITLLGYYPTGNMLLLLWESNTILTQDYTVFVQVLDDAKHIVGQGDAPPNFPTRYWLPKERFLTQHAISYPTPPAAGIYTLVVGWYHPVDFSRLQTAYPDSAYPLTQISLR